MSDSIWDAFDNKDNDPYNVETSPDDILVRKLVMAETDSYNDMAIRPFVANMTGEKVDLLREASRDFTLTETQNLSSIAGQILQPTFQTRGTAFVDNGWDTRRIRFLMEVEYENAGVRRLILVTGWTDKADLSVNGLVDEETQFFVNSVVTLRSIPRADGFGGTQFTTRISNVSQLLRENAKPGSWSSDYNHSTEGALALRPDDIFAQCSTQDLVQELNDTFWNNPESPAVTDYNDIRSAFNRLSPVKLTRRRDSTASSYLANTFKAMRTALHSDEYSTAENVYDKAINSSSDNLLSDNPFLKILNRETSFLNTSAFKLRELFDIAPSARRLVKETPVIRRSNLNLIGTGRGNTTSWSEATRETMVATIIINALPAIAMDSMVSKAIISATNDTMTGEIQVEIMNTADNPPRLFINDANARQCIIRFMDLTRQVVMRDCIQSLQAIIAVTVRLDMQGDTLISVSVDGGPRTDYLAATFMDGLFSTQLTTRRSDLDTMAQSFHDVFENHFDTSFLKEDY